MSDKKITILIVEDDVFLADLYRTKFELENFKVEVAPDGELGLAMVKKIKPDIVHTHLFGGDVWGRVTAHKLHIPVVTTEHNVNIGEGIIKHLVKRFLKNKTDKA